MDYRNMTGEAQKAWAQYGRDLPNDDHNISSFVAGWNMATALAAKKDKEKRSLAARLGHGKKLVKA